MQKQDKTLAPYEYALVSGALLLHPSCFHPQLILISSWAVLKLTSSSRHPKAVERKHHFDQHPPPV